MVYQDGAIGEGALSMIARMLRSLSRTDNSGQTLLRTTKPSHLISLATMHRNRALCPALALVDSHATVHHSNIHAHSGFLVLEELAETEFEIRAL